MLIKMEVISIHETLKNSKDFRNLLGDILLLTLHINDMLIK